MKLSLKLPLMFLAPLLAGGLAINYLAGRAVRQALGGQAAAAVAASCSGVLRHHREDFKSGREKDILPALFLLRDSLGTRGGVAFATPQGRVLAHTDVARKGAWLPEELLEKLGPSGYAFELSGSRERREITVLVPLEEQAVPEDLVLGAAAARIGLLAVTVPMKAEYEAETLILQKIAAILLGVAVFMAAAVYLLSHIALKPVGRLIELTRRVGEGNNAASMEVRGRDEFAQLARSFNEMSGRLSRTLVSRNYLDSIVDGLADALVIAGTDGRVNRLNAAAKKTLGALAREGADLYSLFEDKDWSGRLLAEGEVKDFETRLAGGPATPVQVSAAVIKGADGSAAGIVAAVRDISLRKKYEAELARSNEDLQRFAYVASHDLQEPLRTLSNYVQMVEHKYREALGPDAARHIDFITGAVARMRVMVRDLLEYSRLGAVHRPEEVDAGAALESALELMKNAVSEAGAEVRRNGLPRVLADRAQLERLFQNLVGNAVKFRGSAPPAVDISAERQGAEWVFSVRDNGEGIDPKYAPQLFKLFGRLHGAAVPGSGIGLAACRRIVENHGGRIWFESEPGRGSVFYFTLPAA
jgi:PAS domain S-box-containing protein